MTPKLGLDLAITPGIFSDFDQDSGKAFRLPGHAAAAWTWNETTKFVLGAAYLDRPDVEVIPIGGVIWTPNDDVKFDLVFPHPKISRRIYWSGQLRRRRCRTGPISRASSPATPGPSAAADGRDDQVVLSDYRFILGHGAEGLGRLEFAFEVGYVFGRRIRYSSDTPDFHPTDTVMLRGGLTY